MESRSATFFQRIRRKVIAKSEFAAQDKALWAHVKLVSERLGYSWRDRKRKGRLRRYTVDEVVTCLVENGLERSHIVDPVGGKTTEFGETLCRYLNYRAERLENDVQSSLMDRDEAAAVFEELRSRLNPTCALPMNKQKGAKRHHAYMVGIVNMLTEQALDGKDFAEDPRGLTVITQDGKPLRTFSRWMDGAYPSVVDPLAVWEIKEYYGTTTFGSRVADGVYETMLDGMEFEELEQHAGKKVLHYLIVDDRFTWWDCGRSYLCRIVDMLHGGLVDEVLFGREVLTRWPEIVKGWS